jgi:hypothetical protein
MTLQQAMTVVSRDQALNPNQGGSYTVVRAGDEYDVTWRDSSGRQFRVDLDLTREQWGLAALGG